MRRVPAGLNHTAQAIPEFLVLNNLGLDASTTDVQGWALTLLLCSGWYISRLRDREHNTRGIEVRGGSGWNRVRGMIPPVHPLEAAGGVLILLGFGMSYTARGQYTFDNLRALGWYHAIPQLGAVCVWAGWWGGGPPHPLPRRLDPPTPGELALVVGLATVLYLLQWPRANRVIFEYDGLSAVIRASAEDRPSRPSSRADLIARAEDQRRALARLDRFEEIARSRGIGRSALRKALGRVLVPGMDDRLTDVDSLDLLAIPDEGSLNDPEAIRAAVAGVLEGVTP